MAGFYGGDTEQMRRHGAAGQQGAQRLADITEAMSATIDSVVWQGPDGEAFRALWHSSVKPGMLAGAENVRATAQEIDRHAEEQEHVSAEGGGGGLSGATGGPLGDIFGPGGLTGPLLGAPLLPNMLSALKNSAMDGGMRPGQEFYGADGYLSPGGAAGDDRPLGAYHDDFSVWDGPGLQGEHGHLDPHGRGGYSFGMNETVDQYGNVTTTAGGRAGAEVGFDGELTGPAGTPGLNASGAVGVEAYAEGGQTEGLDGEALGVQAGVGAYAEATVEVEHGNGGSSQVSGDAFAGAEAGANGWNHATRNADGDINGWTVGGDARAFAGADAGLGFEETSPGGWFSGHTSIDVKAGAGGGAGGGATVSTDEIGINLSGELATGLGLGGSTGFSIHPNEIAETITGGRYTVDDGISALGSLKDTGQEWLSDINPF